MLPEGGETQRTKLKAQGKVQAHNFKPPCTGGLAGMPFG